MDVLCDRQSAVNRNVVFEANLVLSTAVVSADLAVRDHFGRVCTEMEAPVNVACYQSGQIIAAVSVAVGQLF